MTLNKKKMSQENLLRFGECVLTLHEKLRTLVKETDLFEELNTLTHQMMDITLKQSSVKKSRTLSYSNNHRNTSISEKRVSTRLKKVCHTSKSSNFENVVSDSKIIKPCFVKLEKICDIELNRLLASNCSNQLQSSSKVLEMNSVHPIEKKSNPTKNLIPVKNIDAGVNINHKFLATEDHLDLLMAVEMESSYPQMTNIVNGKDKCGGTNGMKNHNLKPIVLLERLSPQFIARAINGKLEKRPYEFTQRPKQKVTTLKRIAATYEVRRSKRSSIVKLRCSCCYKSSSSDDKENLPRSKKRSNEKTNYSDDEEEFHGFESQTKNGRRIKKLKQALKTLNAQSSGKENGTTTILNRDFNSLMKHKVPFKAFNRVESQCSVNGDTKFKNAVIEDYRSSIRDNHLNVRNQMEMVRSSNTKCNDVGDDDIALKRLEILKLFKQKEKILVNKAVREQGKVIVSKTGEPLNEDQFLDEPFSYYSKEYRIKGVGRRKPIWAEEIIRNVIIESQEQIPIDIIAGYFHDHHPPDPVSFGSFFQEIF